MARFRIPHLMLLLGLAVPVTGPEKESVGLPKSPKEAATATASSLNLPIWGYFHPAWMPGGLHRFGEAALTRLSKDPESRIEGSFQIPEELRPRVLFWTAVYSRFDSHTKIIHDRNDPSLIYGYLDFSPLFEKQSRMGAAISAERIEKAVLLKVQSALLSIANLAASPLEDSYEEGFRRYLSERGFDEPSMLEALARNVRTQTGQSDVFLDAMNRSKGLLPKMEEVFEAHGLPRALSRIPFVESSFNPKAQSKVGAMGLWQFIPHTAKEMIHSTDRRKWRDPTQQTRAAARLLRRYRKALPDWASTITSYNSGIGRVSRLIDRHQNGVGVILSAEDAELGFAGRNFYSEVLAATLVEAYGHQLFPHEAVLGSSEVATAQPGS